MSAANSIFATSARAIVNQTIRNAAASENQSENTLEEDSLLNAAERELETKDLEAKEPETEDLKTEDLKTKDLKAEDLKIENVEQEVTRAIAQLTSGDFHSKWDFAKQFAKRFEHCADRPVALLIHHLQNSQDTENQWFLVRTLGHFNHPTVVEALANFLMTTPVEALQTEAIKSLTGLGSSAIALLTDLIGSPAVEQRILAARVLAKIRRSAVIAPLISVANDPHEQLRIVATEALGSFHDDRVTPVLTQALRDRPSVAIEAIRALGRRSDLLSSTDIIAQLQHCLTAADKDMAKESAIALGRLAAQGNQPRAAVDALGKFIIQPAPSEVKVTAVRALGWIDSPAATDYLTAAFGYPFPIVTDEVKQEIARSLGQTRSAALKPVAAAPLVSWLQTASQADQQTLSDLTLAGSDLGLNQGLNQGLNRGLNLEINLALKQTVLSAVARLSDSSATQSVIGFMGDPDDRVRMHALSALKQIEPKTGQAKVQHYLLTANLSAAQKERIIDSLTAW